MEFAVLLRLTFRPGLDAGGGSARVSFSEFRRSWAPPELLAQACVYDAEPADALRQFDWVLEDFASKKNMPQ
jgi:hypothetical protein